MALIQDTIPNFIGGVSQQPDKLMFPNQAKELVNMLPDPTLGLCKRYPTEYITKLMDKPANFPMTYTINKEDEKYQVYLDGTGIKVFDLEGNPKTVKYDGVLDRTVYEIGNNGSAEVKGLILYTDVAGTQSTTIADDIVMYYDKYLTHKYTGKRTYGFRYNGKTVKTSILDYVTTNNPLKDLQMVNIGDYTFILNKTVTAQLLKATYPCKYPNAALVFVKQGDYATDYTLSVAGKTITKTTSDNSKADCKTSSIAQALYDGVKEAAGDLWTFTKKNSTILIEYNTSVNFSISTTDSNSDRNLFCFYKETESFTDLPTVAPNGFIIKIIGDNGDTSDDYYVQFETVDGSAFNNGTWKECCAPDLQYLPDASTMPHALVRNSDGTFTFKRLDWSPRRSGDEDTAKTPSLFGQKINEIFTHKGRLAFLAGDKSIYSDTEDIFSLFRKTVMTKLDTEPIDVGSNSKMVLLKHTLPYDGDLLLFSPSSIFTISGGDVFSNSSVTLDLTMEYPCSSLCKPISIGGTGLFVYDNGKYSGVYEIYTASTYTTAARCITEQVPCYLPSGMFKMAGSTRNNMVGFLSTEESNAIYIYNYYYASDTKAQSAWHKWTIDNAEKILNIDFIDNWLYLTIQYSDGVYLEKMNCTPRQIDEGLEFLVHLDRKVKLNGTYDEETKTTTCTLPYECEQDLLNVVTTENGFLLEHTKVDSTISISGNHPELIVGVPYKSLWKLGTIYKKQANSSGGSSTVEGLLMLKDIELSYTASGFFEVDTRHLYLTQNPTNYVCDCPCTNLGTNSAIIGKTSIESGVFLIPVLAKNDEIEFTVKNNSYLPSIFSSLHWLGDLNIRGQK